MSSPSVVATPGRYLLSFSEGAVDEGIRVLSREYGLKRLDSQFNQRQVPDSAVLLKNLGVAIYVPSPTSQFAEIDRICRARAEDFPISAIEPERAVYAIPEPFETARKIQKELPERDCTWGLRAARVNRSDSGGKGVRIATSTQESILRIAIFVSEKL